MYYVRINTFFTKRIVLLLALVSLQWQLSGQFLPSPKHQKTDPKKITIHSNDNQVIDASVDPPMQFLNGNVKIFHSNTFMFCDRAVLQGNILKMYDNVSLLQNDTIRLFADSIFYNGDISKAFLHGKVHLENGATKSLFTSYLEYDVLNKIGLYPNNAKLIDGENILTSRRGRYLLDKNQAFFYDDVFITNNKDFQLVTDSLSYITDSQYADFLSPVRITSDSSELFSMTGWFDLANEKGDFYGNAQYAKANTKATADTISYDGSSGLIHLKSKTLSKYTSDQDTAFARIIDYNRKSETYALIDSAWYRNEDSDVKGDRIVFNKLKKTFETTGRSTIVDGSYIFSGDTINYDKNTQFGIAHGHVIWKDTSSKIEIHSDHLVGNGTENDVLATNSIGRPLFMSYSDGDTLFMKTDTLKSKRIISERYRILTESEKLIYEEDALIDKIAYIIDSIHIKKNPRNFLQIPDSIINKWQNRGDTIFYGIRDSIDNFYGLHNNRIYKKDFQAICDSLVYNRTDSIFTLYKDPFVWSDSSQIYGDTINMTLRNNKVDHIHVLSNSMIINTDDFVFYNQISGRTIVSDFIDGKMHKMSALGSAQLVYYIREEDKSYIGAYTTEAARMVFYFNNNKVENIKNYVEPKSRIYPMKGTNHEGLRLKGFIWNGANRPTSVLNI